MVCCEIFAFFWGEVSTFLVTFQPDKALSLRIFAPPPLAQVLNIFTYIDN